MSIFDKERFIATCREALGEPTEPDVRAAVNDVVARAVSEPSAMISALGEPSLAGIETLHLSDDLTILSIVWAPGMTLYPHNHNMWAVIGIYGGREDNSFFRPEPGVLKRHGLKSLDCGDTIALGRDVIHSVHNPLEKFTLGLHVYGGNFFEQPRSEWDPETLEERPFDIDNARSTFELANQNLRGN